ncbi:LEAF RUST 10 DISEASE-RESISTANCEUS RECEPTOR-LIKE PROTEIN KINASE-like 1.2 [Aristolochia californica]|uniref:LEAF RUST 10 DISEASE-RESISTANCEUS RECEPTOR-LIKE PROTEIN KINASE-like 1.2 n=1 Tax=Aristolochia californica TaxID=171875 RepID=UPI0035DF8BD0
MNPYSSFFVSIILFISARSSNSQGDDPFKTCKPYPFSCGSMNNVTYPFLAGDRPPVCGYTNMTLTCENESPKIVIGLEKYIVKNISYRERLLTIVETDIWSGDCPRPSTETTITNAYEFASPKEVLSIYYDCLNDLSAHKDLIVIRCRGNHSYLSAKPKNSDIAKDCSQTIEVHAMEGARDRLTRNEASYVEVLKEGFQVKWLVGAGWCTECVLSGGICGSNPTVLEQTICLCPDGTRYASCEQGRLCLLTCCYFRFL